MIGSRFASTRTFVPRLARVCATVAGIVLVAGCATTPSGPDTAACQRIDDAGIEQLFRDWNTAIQSGNVERVVIFRVNNTNGGNVPEACKTSSAVGGCHIIPGDAFRAMSTTWNSSHYTATGCLQAASGKGWCPLDRNATQRNADTVGVYVRLRQSNDFKIVGDSLTIERTAAMRIEPEESTG